MIGWDCYHVNAWFNFQQSLRVRDISDIPKSTVMQSFFSSLTLEKNILLSSSIVQCTGLRWAIWRRKAAFMRTRSEWKICQQWEIDSNCACSREQRMLPAWQGNKIRRNTHQPDLNNCEKAGKYTSIVPQMDKIWNDCSVKKQMNPNNWTQNCHFAHCRWRRDESNDLANKARESEQPFPRAGAPWRLPSCWATDDMSWKTKATRPRPNQYLESKTFCQKTLSNFLSITSSSSAGKESSILSPDM